MEGPVLLNNSISAQRIVMRLFEKVCVVVLVGVCSLAFVPGGHYLYAHETCGVRIDCTDADTACSTSGEPTTRGFAVSYRKHEWEIRPEISYIKYEEPGIMKQKGLMVGIGGSYTYKAPVTFKLEGRYSVGRVDYRNSGAIDGIPDYMIELRSLAGYEVRVWDEYVVMPYFGIGYRYLNDDMAGMVSSTGARGYERESNYYYSPVGLEAVRSFTDGWRCGLNIEVDIFWQGKQISHFSDADSNYNDLENEQNEGYGVRGALHVRKQTDSVNVFAEPFFRYWNIRQSDREPIISAGSVASYGCEPTNNSTELGLIVGVVF
jgi:hypothetical protein